MIHEEHIGLRWECNNFDGEFIIRWGTKESEQAKLPKQAGLTFPIPIDGEGNFELSFSGRFLPLPLHLNADTSPTIFELVPKGHTEWTQKGNAFSDQDLDLEFKMGSEDGMGIVIVGTIDMGGDQ